MAAGVLVSVEEYLNTTYRPDCDYVDGEVLERNVGERPHSLAQIEIMMALLSRYPGLRGRVMPEQRVQVRENGFRIPDICILRDEAPLERIIRTAPLLCIEILSKDDTLRSIAKRIDEYLQMGVAVCWIVDPEDRRAWTVTRPGELLPVEAGTLSAPGIELQLADLLF